MGKTKAVPRYHVISLRVSDDEQKTFQELAGNLSVSVSDMMRSALQLYTQSGEFSLGGNIN